MGSFASLADLDLNEWHLLDLADHEMEIERALIGIARADKLLTDGFLQSRTIVAAG